MDRTTASYYRSILFNDAEAQQPIPASLQKLHNFAHKRCQAFGMPAISKMVALDVVLCWMTLTGEGRKFATLHPDLSGLLDDPMDEPVENVATPSVSPTPAKQTAKPLCSAYQQWADVAKGTAVEVTVDDTKVTGEFDCVAGVWLKVRVPGSDDPKPFRPKQVKLAATPASV